jgi:hypothetical protein
MTFNLATIDWNAVSAVSTFLAVLVALFYQPFINRRKVGLETGLSTEDGIHYIRLKVINRGEKPIWIVASGLLYENGEKRVIRFFGDEIFPKKLEPSEMVICPEPVMEYNYKIKNLYAKDSMGRFWYLTKKERKEFNKNVKIFQDLNPELVRRSPPNYVERPQPTAKKDSTQ